MKNLTVAIIGSSYGHKVLYPIIKNNKRLQIVGFSSKNIVNKKFLFNENKLIISSSWKKMIVKTNPDLVIISVPPKVQELILAFLIDKKINFFAEKPIGVNYVKLQKLFLQYKKNNLCSAIDFNFVSLPIMNLFKLELKRNGYTNIIKYKIEWSFASKSKTDYQDSWKQSNLQGGGTINNYGSHIFSIIEFLFDNTEYLKAKFIKQKANIYEEVLIKTIHENKLKGNIHLIPKITNYRKFMIKIYYKNKILELINKSTDYHNNFYLFVNKNGNKELINSYRIKSKLDSRSHSSNIILKKLIKSIDSESNINLFSLDLGFKVQKLIESSKISSKLKKTISINEI